MKTPYKNIYTVLGTNRIIVIGCIATTAVISIFSILMVIKMNKQALNSMFAVNVDGTVMPMQLIEESKNLEIEILQHLKMFHTYFYDFNPTNYQENVEKALWLGDNSVDKVYLQKKADGVFNRLVQFNLIQKVIDIKSDIDVSSVPYRFTSVVTFEINRGTIIDKYQITTSGEITSEGITRNFPKNPHGLRISKYYEKQLKKINNEVR